MNNPDETAPSPNFYAIIPAPVLYCPTLPPAAKLLFGEIVALTSVRGYCFAQNPHFVERHGVSSRAVQKWLSALSKHGFIRIDFVGEERRIYATAMVPNSPVGGRKKVHTPPNKSSYPPEQKFIHITKDINKENIKSELSSCAKFVGPGPVAARELQAREGTVSASPSTLKSNSGNPRRVRAIEQAVAKCGDVSARVRFSGLWDLADVSGCGPDVWRNGLDAVNAARGTSTGLLGGLAAIFTAAVKSGIDAVACGVPAEPSGARRPVGRQGPAAAAAVPSDLAGVAVR